MPALTAAFPRRTLITATLAAPLGASSAAEPVRLPHHLGAEDPQLPYVQRVVQLALERVGRSADIRLVDLDMAQSRSLTELAAGTSPFDLMWTMTDTHREASGLLPVRIPIDRGLMGWRLLLVREDDLPRWRGPLGLPELRRRSAGQGHDWPDTAILRANELPVATASNYDALFRMLRAQRFDYFPRSILEIDAELAGNRHPGLAIVPDLMLHYPAASYLFVSPRRPELALQLKEGLELSVADGSLRRLHHEAYGALLRAHPVAPSRVLRLRNPLLPPLTPLQRRELWLQPGEASGA